MSQQQKKLASKSSLGLKLVNVLDQRAKKILTEHSEINENGDVSHLSDEDVLLYLWEDERFGDLILTALEELLPELKDQVTCEQRQAWSDQKERERTDRREAGLEKNRQINLMKNL